jgi:hypothetical protein
VVQFGLRAEPGKMGDPFDFALSKLRLRIHYFQLGYEAAEFHAALVAKGP